MNAHKLGRLAVVIKTWAANASVPAVEVQSMLALLCAGLALGHNTTREDFLRGCGEAFDEAKKRARGNGLVVGPGVPIVRG